jgi:hypothetical protein
VDDRSDGSAHPAGVGKARDVGLVRINDAEALDNLEGAVAGLGDVHVHANMMLTGHYFGRTARSLDDPGAVESLDDVVLPKRAGLVHGRRPAHQAAVEARVRTAPRELRVARIELVVPAEQLLTEWIADALVEVEATLQALHMCSRHQAQEVLVEIGADDLSAAPGEAGVVKLLQKGQETGRPNRPSGVSLNRR